MPTWPLRRAAPAPAESQGSVPAVPPAPRPVPSRLRKLDEGRASHAKDDLGDVAESKDAHLARHGGGRKDCIRCRWYQNQEIWTRSYGFVTESNQAGPRRNVAWLAERPRHWGGLWALGCTMCADAAARQAVGDQGTGPRRFRRGTTWARFEARPQCLQAEHIRQHKDYDVHRVAVLAWLRPGLPVQLSLQANIADDG